MDTEAQPPVKRAKQSDGMYEPSVKKLRKLNPIICPANKTRTEESYKTIASDQETFRSAGLSLPNTFIIYLCERSTVLLTRQYYFKLC